MRLFLPVAIAAALGASVLTFGSPASAQVDVEVGAPGAGVRIGDPDYRYRERRRRVREYENTGSCRTITVRRERADGTMVTRRERRCE